jgi:hypothetical protein
MTGTPPIVKVKVLSRLLGNPDPVIISVTPPS